MNYVSTSSTSDQSRKVVTAFREAQDRGDLVEASSYLAEDFTFESPMMKFERSRDYLASYESFRYWIAGLDMISGLYGDGEATLVYDLHTATPAGSQRTAEHFRLAENKISAIVVIFDATKWQPIMDAVGYPPGARKIHGPEAIVPRAGK